MKNRRKAAAVGVVAVLVLAVGAVLLWLAYEPMHLRLRLLFETDHPALLNACQNVAKGIADGNLKPGKYRFRPWPSRSVSLLPRAIRALKPTYVLIAEDGRIAIEMFGGLSNFGVYAYPEDYRAPFAGFKYGDRELVSNLWYYDDEYHRDPQFDKAVGELLGRRDDVQGTKLE